LASGGWELRLQTPATAPHDEILATRLCNRVIEIQQYILKYIVLFKSHFSCRQLHRVFLVRSIMQ